eukprot:CAMPEP_0119314822 /NCGR_PEP_ID=MMETSP1333-20130426/34051_1 /TAXON_ID=418940 /ORGANISM="Scyphosphaera apsteinii, Strain RCC1455" /LENGTH=68 /DNA_ID=CAMNT_0007320021 /DNA_START=339 /DNA_END=541 /DNA_ORIENTATION=-
MVSIARWRAAHKRGKPSWASLDSGMNMGADQLSFLGVRARGVPTYSLDRFSQGWPSQQNVAEPSRAKT